MLEVVVMPFVVTVPSGTPAVRVVVTNSGEEDYDFVAVEPVAYATDLGAGSLDPAITLFENWRRGISPLLGTTTRT